MKTVLTQRQNSVEIEEITVSNVKLPFIIDKTVKILRRQQDEFPTT